MPSVIQKHKTLLYVLNGRVFYMKRSRSKTKIATALNSTFKVV